MKIKNIKINNYLLFTFLFFITAALCFIQFPIYGKSFLVGDGLQEHTTFLAFYGGWLREILFNFIHGNFRIPTFSFSLGFGADVISTLSWFCVGDPINLIAVFFPKSAAYFLFVFLAFVRLWLLGVSFIFYCNKHNFSKNASAFGAVAYSLCGYALCVGIRHPYFLNPMIYLPLLCLGIDRILNKEKPFLFIVSTFLSCISNYYFFYMLSIFIFIYALVRFFFSENEISIKGFAAVFLKTLCFYFIGVAMAAFILLPNVYGFLNASRTTQKIDVPLLRSLRYYVGFFCSPVAPIPFGGSYGILGFSVPIFLVTVFVFSLKDKISQQFKIFIAIGLVFFFFPFFAHMMNGFNYLSNRWAFAFAFPVCTAFAYGFPILCKSNKKEIKIPLFIVILQNIIVLAACLLISKLRSQYAVCYIYSLIIMLAFFFIIKTGKTVKNFLFVSLLIGVIVNSTVRFSPYCYNYISKYNKSGIYSENYNASTDSEILKLKEHDFFRYDEDGKFTLNNSAIFGTFGTNYYYSLSDKHLTGLFEEMALATSSRGMQCNGLDKRSSLQNFFAVKYYVQPAGSSYLPENMTFIKEFDTYNGKKKLYKINNASSFATSYKNTAYVESLDFKNLTPLEKQELFARQAILFDNVNFEQPIENSEKFDFSNKITKGNVKFSCEDGIELRENKISVHNKNARLIIDFKFPQKDKKEELYLFLKNIRYTTDHSDSFSCGITFESSDVSGSSGFMVTSENDEVGHDKMPCFGLQNCSAGKFYVSFNLLGDYEFDEISVFSLDIQNSDSSVSNLETKNYNFGANTISFDVNLPEKEFVRFSVPYSKGWKIYLDGKKADLQRCNVAFIGAFIENGQHNVKLVYHTPWLALGTAISLFGLVLLIIMLIFTQMAKNK